MQLAAKTQRKCMKILPTNFRRHEQYINNNLKSKLDPPALTLLPEVLP